jgi:hypothetical protein
MPSSNIRQIAQTPAYIMVHTESFSMARVIPLGPQGRPAPARGGSSTGHWEGDTLVVETSGFPEADDMRSGIVGSFPISPQTRMTERFIRTGPYEIRYRFTIEDPLLYTQAWTGESTFERSDERMYEFACHEGNYSMSGILGGARAEERHAGRN